MVCSGYGWAVLRKSMFADPILGFCHRCPQSLCCQMLYSHPSMLSCRHHDHRESIEVAYFGCCISITSQMSLYHQSRAKDHTKMAWPHLLDLGIFHHGCSILCPPLYIACGSHSNIFSMEEWGHKFGLRQIVSPLKGTYPRQKNQSDLPCQPYMYQRCSLEDTHSVAHLPCRKEAWALPARWQRAKICTPFFELRDDNSLRKWSALKTTGCLTKVLNLCNCGLPLHSTGSSIESKSTCLSYATWTHVLSNATASFGLGLSANHWCKFLLT